VTFLDDGIGAQQVRRDRFGRYLVVPPTGGKPKGYTRATTVAKALDDQSSLVNWSARVCALGLAQRPDLLAAVATTNPDDRQALDALCERAKEAGGATARRDLGTALHAMVERSYTEPGYAPPEAYAADVTAVRTALDAAGLTPLEGLHERMVVLDRLSIAGTFDLAVRDASGTIYVADLKTGRTIEYGGLGFAIQLAIYAQADALYTQGAAADGSQDSRDTPPQFDRSRALIVHVQPGSGVADLHWLDIARGAEALDVAMQVRTWRSTRNLLTPLKIAPGDAATHTPLPVEQVAPADPPPPSAGATTIARPEGRALPSAEQPPALAGAGGTIATAQAIADITARIAALTDEQRTTLKAEWSWPSLKSGNVTVDDAESIERLIDRVTMANSRKAAQRVTNATPHVIDEGADIDAATVDALGKSYAALDEQAKSWIAGLEGDARQAGYGFRVKERPTVRRFEIVRALVKLADERDPDAVRALLALAQRNDDVMQPTLPLGACIGLLDATTAATFARHVDAYCLGELPAVITETGQLRFDAA
jgi:hypothetical protein